MKSGKGDATHIFLQGAEKGTQLNCADLSCVPFTPSPSDMNLREQYAARAVELLRQAVAKGYKNIKHMNKDKDLDPLRERQDFKKLMADLEKKQ